MVIVLNAGSGAGGADDARTILDPILAEGNIAAEYVVLSPTLNLRAALDDALRTPAEAVVAGGGDGTVNSVADIIHDRDVPLGVLPLGTLNHFARDLGIPVELAEAARVLVNGQRRRVDAAAVNDRVFVNNSSVGLYARVVALRTRYKARGPAKWLVASWATLSVARRSRPLRVRIEVDGRAVVRTTPLLFIGNNAYRMEGLQAGGRDAMDTGRLALYVVKTDGVLNLLRLAWRVVLGTAHDSRELAMVSVATARIELADGSARDQVTVAIDGEVTPIELPLEYRSMPGALEVLVPA